MLMITICQAKNLSLQKIEEFILKSNKPDFMDSAEKVEDLLKNPSDSKLPKGIFKSSDIDGTQVFTFGDENAANTILYMHGGAYVMEINYQHLLYCLLLSRKLDAYVVAPVYPLAPKSSAMQTYDVITGLYEMLI